MKEELTKAEMSSEITKKEIRGITSKTIGWILGFIIPITIAATFGYAKMTNTLDNNTTNSENIQVQILLLQTEMKEINKSLTDFNIRIVKLEDKK